jgi:hypothetical protein
MCQIRLACRLCDRADFDFVEKLPTDWFSVEEVQDYEASLRKACPDIDVQALPWFTHLGVCPGCYEAEIVPALTS